jgi:hypothetical protein
MSTDRKHITKALTTAAAMHLSKRGFGVFTEIGIAESTWHKKRIDVYGINLRGKTIAIEVKSGRADFKSDHKYESYLPYSHQLYFCVHDTDWIVPCYPELRRLGIGVLLLCNRTGFLRTVLNAKKRKMKKSFKYKMICRLAWRAATYSKRNTRRRRIYIHKEIANATKSSG